MQRTSLAYPQYELLEQQFLRPTNEVDLNNPNEQIDIQPLIARLRIIYLQYMNCDDELSLDIQEIAEKFTNVDCSNIRQLSDIIKIAQDCRSQFSKLLFNDFDKTLLEEEPVVVREWKCEKWQLEDFIKLDKYFEGSQVPISPFDDMPFSEELPKHEFAQAITELLKTLPDFPQEVTPAQLREEEQALVGNQTGQQLTFFPFQGNDDVKLSRQHVEDYPPEKDLFIAWDRYQTWKHFARCSVQEKKNKTRVAHLKIDIAARKLANRNHLQEIINQEAQRLLSYFEERQEVMQDHLEEVEQARTEIANLKGQLDECTKKLKKLQEDLTVQEKKSESLEQQIRIEQAKYIRLAQEIEEIRNRCKKKPWWKFW